MEDFFSYVAAGFGVLILLAAAVAWWEHLARIARPPKPPDAAPARLVKIDVPLDTVAGVLLPASDTDTRRAALGGAMERMGRVGRAAHTDVAPANEPWPSTSPMVLQPTPEPGTVPTPKSRA